MKLCICFGICFSSKSVLPKTNVFSNLELIMAQQTVFLLMEMFFLNYVNETLYWLENLPFFKIQVNCFMTGEDSP